MIAQFQDLIRPDDPLRSDLRTQAVCLGDAGDIRGHLDTALAPHSFSLTNARSSAVGFWHRSVDLAGMSVHYIDYECDAEHATVDVDQPQDGIMLKLPLAGATVISVDGDDYVVEPNQFAIIRPGAPFRAVMAGDSRHVTLTIEGSWLQGYLASRDLGLRHGDLSFQKGPYNVQTDGLLLSGVITSLICSLARGDGTLGAPGVVTHLKELITSAVLGLSPEYRLAGRADDASDSAPAYVRRAERFMRENLDQPIDMGDIIHSSGVMRRTLYSGFRRHRGTTPMAFLKALRLKAAKQALERTPPGRNAVTEIAMTYGFFHLGRFSRDFKLTYGVLPSELVGRNDRSRGGRAFS
ncbi:AraC family transcriptional regulator [Amorphus sp. 3PC139-8]|uniref:AraC family transcriptional regulator n=1 Tax=Amorphus sp. 3PC139-8 TaxID=2735676 RepID=UPI00345DEA47